MFFWPAERGCVPLLERPKRAYCTEEFRLRDHTTGGGNQESSQFTFGAMRSSVVSALRKERYSAGRSSVANKRMRQVDLDEED